MPGELSNLPTIITWRSFRCNIFDSQLVDSPQDLVVQADPLMCHAESVLPAMSKIFRALGTRTKLSNSQFLGCATFSSTINGVPGRPGGPSTNQPRIDWCCQTSHEPATEYTSHGAGPHTHHPHCFNIWMHHMVWMYHAT